MEMAMARRTDDDDDILRPSKRPFKLTPHSADPASKIDRISSLPDEVLVFILSLLTFEEAAFTRLLSKRWINLWFYIPLSSFVVDHARELGFFNTLMKHLTLGACKLCPPLKFHCFKSLKSLSLKCFHVTSGEIDKIFSQCPVLEHFNITKAMKLVDFKAVGTNLQLKHLELYDCRSLGNLEIHTPNLVSFRYEGPLIELSLACGDQFDDVYFHISPARCIHDTKRPATCKSRVSYLASQFKSYISQLKTFTLKCKSAEVELGYKMLPTFSNLTTLVIFLMVRRESAIPFTSFLKVSPLLKRLELHYIWRNPSALSKLLHSLEGSNWEHVSENAPHQLLREVLLSGFRGLPEDMELSMYLLHNAVALENFTIDPCERSLYGSRWERYENEGIPAARKCAELLLGKKSQQVEMLIL